MLAIIPARGGSKRIHRKNLKHFLGEPLIAWSIKAAINSGVFDKVLVSTDDPEIASISQRYGAVVPFMRPKELATDSATVDEAAKHALKELKDQHNYQSRWFFLLEPSSPGRQKFHIQEVSEILKCSHENYDALVGVSKISPNQTPEKALKIFSGNELKRHDGKLIQEMVHRTQDVSDFYFINSAIYAFKSANLEGSRASLWGERVRAYVMDGKYAMDIDTNEDWELAEIKMKKLLARPSEAH